MITESTQNKNKWPARILSGVAGAVLGYAAWAGMNKPDFAQLWNKLFGRQPQQNQFQGLAAKSAKDTTNSHSTSPDQSAHVQERMQYYVNDFNMNSALKITKAMLQSTMDSIPTGPDFWFMATDPGQGIEANPQNGNILRQKEIAYGNVPAGGFFYGSSGPATYEIPGMPTLRVTKGEKEHIVNQVYILGRVAPEGDATNMTIKIKNDFPGHMFVTQAQPSSQEDRTTTIGKINPIWDAQQLLWGGVNPNCSVGCKTILYWVVDPNTKSMHVWEIDPNNSTLWKERTDLEADYIKSSSSSKSMNGVINAQLGQLASLPKMQVPGSRTYTVSPALSQPGFVLPPDSTGVGGQTIFRKGRDFT